MNFNFKKNFPFIIIATISVALFGIWYLTFNVNKKIIIQGAADEPAKKTFSESAARDYSSEIPDIPVYLETPAFSKATPTPSDTPEAAEIPTVMKDGKININTADKELLQSLPGIGETLAGSIINYRNEYGSFKSIEEIQNVSRIGEKTFERLKNLIYVD